MRHALIHGVAIIVAFSVPAFASTGDVGPNAGVRGTLAPPSMQVATNEDGAVDAAFAIFRQLDLEEGAHAVNEGMYRGDRLEEMANPNVPEEFFEENFRCAVAGAIGLPIKCLHL
jgi:hypothetical protein